MGWEDTCALTSERAHGRRKRLRICGSSGWLAPGLGVGSLEGHPLGPAGQQHLPSGLHSLSLPAPDPDTSRVMELQHRYYPRMCESLLLQHFWEPDYSTIASQNGELSYLRDSLFSLFHLS